MATPQYNGVIEPKGLEGLKGLRSWGELSQEEQSSWLDSHPSAKQASPLKRAVLYRNNNYLETLGQPVYDAYDVNTLGKLYKEKVVNDAFFDYYKDDSNFNFLNTFTTEGKEELLRSGYLNDAQQQEFIDSSYNKYDENMKKAAPWMPATPGTGGALTWENKDEYTARLNGDRARTLEATIARNNKGMRKDSEEEIDSVFKFYSENQDNWGKIYEDFTKAVDGKEDLNKVLDNMVNTFMITQDQREVLDSYPIEQKVNTIGEILDKSDYNPARIDNMFGTVALPQTYSAESEFGEAEDYQLPGSRTYNQLKSTDKFSNFTAADKLREYVTWQVISQKYGTTAAISQLETAMMEYAKSQEDFWDWFNDVSLNITLGGVANIMNKVNAIDNLIVSTTHGAEGLANKLQGKHADGSERDQTDGGNIFNWFVDNWDNPLYWSKVDEYNTLDPFMIQDIDANGGISPFTTIRLPDAPIKFFSKETLAEALKMAKFAWSDYLINSLVLRPVANGITAGATKINPGFGNFVNKATSFGVLAGSSLGISESYGVQTFEQAYQSMMESLDKQRDLTAQQYAQDQMNSPEGRAQIEEVVNRLVKQQQQANVGKDRSLTVSEEQIRKMVEDDFLNYQIQEYNKGEEATRSRSEDEELAKKAAAHAYMVDATIEQIRMMANTSLFRGYILDKGTQRTLGINRGVNGYSRVTENAEKALTAADKKLSTAIALAKPFIGGFTSNYFDDVTVAFGRGFGLGEYDNYLAKKYNPETDIQAANFTLNFLDGLGEGFTQSVGALFDRQSFYDGFIGALGTPFSLVPRLTGSERRAARETVGKVAGEKLTASEWLQVHTMNPLIEAYYNEKQLQRKTDKALPTLNKVIKDNEQKLQEIKQSIISLNTLDKESSEGTELSRKDAKDDVAFQLAMLMSGASSAPIIGESSTVQEAAQKLDAMARGNISEEDITRFLTLPQNREAASDPKARNLAKSQIQKNAKDLKRMIKSLADANNTLENTVHGFEINDDVKEQLLYSLVMKDSWTNRLSDIEKVLTGRSSEYRGSNVIARYGNAREYERNLNAQVQSMVDLRAAFDRENSKLHNATKYYKEVQNSKEATKGEIEQAKNDVLSLRLSISTIQEAMRDARSTLKQLEREGKVFKEGKEVPVLTAEEILSLNPRDRATILNKDNRENYSEEQQIAIDKALATLYERSLDADTLIKDAATLKDRIDRSTAATRRFAQNPDAAAAFVSTIQQNRGARAKYVLDQRKTDAVYKTLDSAANNEELTAKAREAMNSNDVIFGTANIAEYIKKNPDKKSALSGLLEVSKVRDAAYYAIRKLVNDPRISRDLIKQSVELTANANNEAEAMQALESLIDIQTSADAKRQIDRILEQIKTYGHQRDATILRNRAEERKRKQEEELRKAEEEAKLDGKNYNWDGYKVGDIVYNKETGNSGVVVGFEKLNNGENKMLIQIKYSDNIVGTIRYDSVTGKDKVTKEQPKPKEGAPEGAVPTMEDSTTSGHRETNSDYELTSVSEVDLALDEEGALQSPSAAQQAASFGTEVIAVPETDVTDQGNVITETTGLVSGNRWVTYSLSALAEEGIIREEVPKDKNSIYGKIFSWLKANNVHLQEIIDEEFSRMVVDNPNLEVQFMLMNSTRDQGLQGVLFPVVKLTQAMRDKYHQDSRGGIFTVNGESWLIVGTSGFDSNASVEQRKAMDKMRGPINRRRNEYFRQHSSDAYYVDPVVKTKVQRMSSGRLVRQSLGETEVRLRKVSELLASDKKSLKQAQFGVQTNTNGEKGFATTLNVKDDSKVFPPKNSEDNLGRAFVLIDTVSGNKIPAMLNPTMLNDIPENSTLRDIIDDILARITSTNYSTRVDAIKELCGYLILGENKNILIGNENTNTLTIRREGFPDVTQTLGEKFDSVKFLNDVKNANFQINVTLRGLNDPVMLKIYDDAGALMTNISQMRTAGMAYTLYMSDENGNLIINTPTYNPKPGTGETAFKTYKTVFVNNTQYELQNGQFVNRSNNSKVSPGTALERSCIYNLEIKESGRSPLFAQGNLQYFMLKDGEIVTRDSFGNIEVLDAQTSSEILSEIQSMQEKQKRDNALQDVILDEEPVSTDKTPEEVPLTMEQVAAQEFGDFSSPPTVETPQKPITTKEIVTEAKETQSSTSKEAISSAGTKSLEELQKSKNSFTFADVISNIDYTERVYEVLESKDWGITGNLAADEKILKSKNISVVGITNVEDWLEMIDKCR